MLSDIQVFIDLVHKTRSLIVGSDNAHKITQKGLADFVTKVDTSVQDFLKEQLELLTPDVQFMGEENHMNQIDTAKPAWILDPIDGTTNLIFDFHHSAVSLGYYDGREVTLGIVYNPFTEETFWAQKHKGAFLNGCPIHVTDHKTVSESLISIGTSPYDRELSASNFRLFQRIFESSLDIRRTGAASLDLAYTACGRLDGYIEKNLKPWDFAAGFIILTEAGGKVTTYEGAPVDFCQNQNIAASNSLIHDEFIRLLSID